MMIRINKISMLNKSILILIFGFFLISSFNCKSDSSLAATSVKGITLEDFVKLQYDVDYKIKQLIIQRDSLKIEFYKKLAIEMGDRFKIDKALLYGLWMQESQMNPTAKGDGGKAHGLGQVHLTTTRSSFDSSITSVKLMEPITNGAASATYLKQCLDKNRGNLYRGISCYRLGKDSKGMDWEYTAKVLRYATEWRD